jgi:hypothetical protein
MRRSHRSAHRLLWPLLAVCVALGLSFALALRPPIPVEPGAVSEGARR